MRLSKLESNLIKLQWVRHRITAIYRKFSDIHGNDKTTELFKNVLRETIILQLDNFIIIRRSLIKNPNVKKVDVCLKPLWKPIIDYEKPIKLYRNNYIAHVQDKSNPFKLMPEHIVDQYQMPTPYAEWLYRCGCMLSYCKQLEANFDTIWKSAEKKYISKMPLALSYGNLRLGTYKNKLSISRKEAIENLKKNNLKVNKVNET